MTMRQDPTHPTGVSDNSPRGGSAVANARMRKAMAAVDLRKAGVTWDEVAQILGYPTAHTAIVATEKALEKDLQNPESQKFLRKLAADRYDRLLRAVWSKAVDETRPDQLAYLDRARLIMGDANKLLGLNAPTEMVVSTPTQAELDELVATVTSRGMPEVEEPDIFELELGDDGVYDLPVPTGNEEN